MLLGREEITTVFQENYQSLCRFLESIVGRNGCAQDIAQESFLRLCRAGIGDVAITEIRFWLFRVARNLALNEVNKINTRAALQNRVIDFFQRTEPPPDQAFERNENQRIVNELLNRLPEHQRSALLLREQEEMNYREIAIVLNVTEAKIKVDIFRARAALREEWRKKYKRQENKTLQEGFER